MKFFTLYSLTNYGKDLFAEMYSKESNTKFSGVIVSGFISSASHDGERFVAKYIFFEKDLEHLTNPLRYGYTITKEQALKSFKNNESSIRNWRKHV